jgi:hypothetical protein
VRRQALARIAALKQGGTTAQTVLAELAGVAQPRTGRNIREQRFETMAAEQLGPDATPGAIAKRAEELRVASESAVTGGRKTAGIVAEGRVQVARALQNINAIRQTAKQVLTTSALASYAQPIEFFFRRKFRDPKLSALQAIPATLSDLARALGEKGVLTDTDLERVRQALLPQETDTWDTFNARVTFVENLMREGQKALERAASTGVIEPVNSAPLGTFEGDPFPPDEAGEGKTPEGGSSKKEMARQAYEKAKTIKDPVAQRAFVEAELRRINGSVE